MSTIEVSCPCCGEMLVIDALAATVLSHRSTAPAEKKMDLSSFVKAQPGRAKELEEQFRKAKEDQDRRKKDLEDQFFKAKKDPSSIQGGYTSPFDFD